jgi:hypothetical protein
VVATRGPRTGLHRSLCTGDRDDINHRSRERRVWNSTGDEPPAHPARAVTDYDDRRSARADVHRDRAARERDVISFTE